jgi:hypothetical protein
MQRRKCETQIPDDQLGIPHSWICSLHRHHIAQKFAGALESIDELDEPT